MPRRSLALAIPALLLLALGFALWRTVASDGPSVVAPATPPPVPLPHDAERAAVGAAADAAIVPERALATPTSDLPTVEVVPGRALLLGFIADRAGVVVDTSTLWFGEPGGRADRTPATRSAIEGGEYALPSLPAAIVPFRIEAEGFATLELALDLRAGGVLRHDFLLDRPASLTIQLVRPDGSPWSLFHVPSPTGGVAADEEARRVAWFASGAGVIATEALPPARYPPTSGSRAERHGLGEFRRADEQAPRGDKVAAIPSRAFGALETPRLPVEVSLLFMHEVVATQRVTSAEAPVRFVIDPTQLARLFGEVRGRVIDAPTGEPLSGAAVMLNDSQSFRQGGNSGADGRFTLPFEKPGWKTAQVEMPGRARWQRSVLVEAGVVTDLGDLAIDVGLTLRGTLVDDAGRPLGARLHAWPLDGHTLGAPFGAHHYWGVEEPGKFEISGLGKGRYVIGAQGDEEPTLQARAIVDLTSGSPPSLPLVMMAATLVEFEPGLAPGRFVVSSLQRSDGVLELASLSRTDHRFQARLLPGSWCWTLHEEGRELRRVTFQVGSKPLRISIAEGAAEATIAEVDASGTANRASSGSETDLPTLLPAAFPGLVRGILLVGRVQDGAGAPVAGANITATPLDGSARYGRSQADGTFAIAGLAADRFDLRARATGCVPALAKVDLAANREPPAVVLTLERATVVEVHLEDETGAPLSRAFAQRFPHSQLAQEVRVIATLDAPGATVSRSTRGVGQWRPNWQGGPGTLELSVPPPLFVSALHAGRALASAELAEGEASIHLHVPVAELDAARATLRFRLVDADSGAVVMRAFAGLTGLNGSTHGDAVDLPAASGGVITLADQQAGRRNLSIALDGQVFFNLIVELPPGETVDLGDLLVRSPTALRGTLVDERGAPLAGALRLVHLGLDGQPTLEGTFHQVEADADGRFEFSTALPRVRLQPSTGEYALDPTIIDVAAAEAAGGELQVVLRSGVATALRPGRVDEACEVALLRGGQLLRRTQLQAGDALRVRLVAGSYQAIVEYDGTPPIEQRFEVGATALEVALP
ncbi:MAG: carboxypeptidase regulatory-like domain-containing protein [Planctomycetes bacterium]|nr:carboxypeptidase regulatory-like domain-containing protein [Planctomycetota bacterium]